MMLANFIGLDRLLVFELPDLIAQRRGAFVVLFLYRLLEIFRQGPHAIVPLERTVSALREFADMLGSLVHRLQQTAEPFGERHVTDAATEPARFLEIGLGESADWTFLGWRPFFDLFRGADAEQQIRQREAGRILH